MGNKIISQINDYYTEKLIKHGATPQGVDWNSTESQFLRFEVLSSLIETNTNFSILDFGCGFGSMLDYFNKKYQTFNFHGFDISAEMISKAQELHKNNKHSFFTDNLSKLEICDYVIASGIFNVRLENSNDEWLEYILDTIHQINKYSSKGFAINLLTSYSDKEFMKDYLYYADPLFLFDFCKKEISKYVTLKHDYPLYEFSLIIKK